MMINPIDKYWANDGTFIRCVVCSAWDCSWFLLAKLSNSQTSRLRSEIIKTERNKNAQRIFFSRILWYWRKWPHTGPSRQTNELPFNLLSCWYAVHWSDSIKTENHFNFGVCDGSEQLVAQSGKRANEYWWNDPLKNGNVQLQCDAIAMCKPEKWRVDVDDDDYSIAETCAEFLIQRKQDKHPDSYEIEILLAKLWNCRQKYCAFSEQSNLQHPHRTHRH